MAFVVLSIVFLPSVCTRFASDVLLLILRVYPVMLFVLTLATMLPETSEPVATGDASSSTTSGVIVRASTGLRLTVTLADPDSSAAFVSIGKAKCKGRKRSSAMFHVKPLVVVGRMIPLRYRTYYSMFLPLS